MVRGIAAAAAVLGISVLTVGSSLAATATRRPSPPPQVCIGSNCVTTTPGSGQVKWNPGHYGASGGLAYPNDQFSKFTPEMDDMLKDDWIKGYRIFITWSAPDAGPVSFHGSVGGATKGTLSSTVNDGSYWTAFDNGEYRQVTVSGTSVSWTGALSAGSVTNAHLYTTGMLDQMLDRMKTRYGKPKQLVIAQHQRQLAYSKVHHHQQSIWSEPRQRQLRMVGPARWNQGRGLHRGSVPSRRSCAICGARPGTGRQIRL